VRPLAQLALQVKAPAQQVRGDEVVLHEGRGGLPFAAIGRRRRLLLPFLLLPFPPPLLLLLLLLLWRSRRSSRCPLRPAAAAAVARDRQRVPVG